MAIIISTMTWNEDIDSNGDETLSLKVAEFCDNLYKACYLCKQFMVVDIIRELTNSSGAGPPPKFCPYHIWKTYEIIEKNGPIGRSTLSQELRLPEGSVRTILERMKSRGDIETTRRGSTLSKTGIARFKNSGIVTKFIDLSDFTKENVNFVVQVKGIAQFINNEWGVCEEKDGISVLGIIILIRKNGKLLFLDKEEFLDDKTSLILEKSFTLGDNDVIIIVPAKNEGDAERFGINVAIALMEQVSKCGNDGWRSIKKYMNLGVLKCIALLVHEVMGELPVTMRTRDSKGVRCEGGRIIDTDYTGPVLEEALEKNQIIRKVSPSGPYKGVPIVAVPIMDGKKAFAVIACVDITKGAMFEMLKKSWGRYSV